MLFLAVALYLLGALIGAAAQLPPTVTLLAGTVITCWLLLFAVRERTRRRRSAV
ncbi:hypothetical protein [Streptomyces sp. AJS327]|uniref:hypothetical protein n=1 Tax=Streptomyces sp. AJS327 TaxID=2545265 RepID=UPI0015DD78FA|nr:hypothetical protein [Streptomyces sp. AJS327]